jgi:hypothetical protein
MKMNFNIDPQGASPEHLRAAPSALLADSAWDQA